MLVSMLFMDAFRFSPEFIEERARVIEELSARGFSWLSHYSAVDCIHNVHGLEVCQSWLEA